MFRATKNRFRIRHLTAPARLCTVALFLTLLPLPGIQAENWPQWRGPSGNGISGSSDLPVHWSRDENIAWKARLSGLGVSSPVVWENTVFVTSQQGKVPLRQGSFPLLARDDRDLAQKEIPIGERDTETSGPDGKVLLVVEAFRLSDGGRLWKYETPATGEFPELHEKHNLATPTPVTDGKRVYALFGTGQVMALDMDGKPAWTRHLGLDYAPFTTNWGHGGSPILYQDTLLILCDHTGESYLVALDKNTGKERWKIDRGRGRISHATPLVVQGPARKELIINSSERIDALDPADGTLLWHAGSRRQTPVPSPVYHDGVIYLSRGYRNSDFLAIRPGGEGDVTASHILWRSAGGASYVPSILYYQGLLYVTNEVGIVTCADATDGKSVWKKRLGGIFFASPVAGDGKLYMTSETGEVYVLEAGRKPILLATNHLDERMIASPAVSDGRILLRSDGTLFCIGRAGSLDK